MTEKSSTNEVENTRSLETNAINNIENNKNGTSDGANEEDCSFGVDGERAERIRANFLAVYENIMLASSSFREGNNITMLAATKNVPVNEINFAAENLGLKVIGENRVQELVSKYDSINREKLDIHFIGNLQTNKVKYLIDKVSLIQSLDSLRLAAEIDKQAKRVNRVMDTLIEINIGGEPSKGGILPGQLSDFLDGLERFDNVRVKGLMTMAPISEDMAEYKKYFEKTYDIFIDILQKRLHNIDDLVLSMGMSDSYIPAIECGSTMIRLGSALFGDVRKH